MKLSIHLKSLCWAPLTVYLLLLVTPAAAFWRHLCHGTLGIARIDPIVSPGTASQHAHVAFGAASFAMNVAAADLFDPPCTSCSIVQDKSIYWTPQLYFQYDNGTLEEVATSGGMTVYYFTEAPDVGATIVPFPFNFRMVAGNSDKRNFSSGDPMDDDPPEWQWGPAETSQVTLGERAIGFNCLNYGGNVTEGALEYHGLRNKTFLDAHCPDGLRAELMFPSCWNGRDLTPVPTGPHVLYRQRLRNGACPAGYNVSLPVLFYETIYDTPRFTDVDGEFVFANGDPTGFGYHGDFIAGWDAGVLEAALLDTSCTAPNSSVVLSGNQEDCHVFDLQDDGLATNCFLTVPTALASDRVNGSLTALPGNVSIFTGAVPSMLVKGRTVVNRFATGSGRAVSGWK